MQATGMTTTASISRRSSKRGRADEYKKATAAADDESMAGVVVVPLPQSSLSTGSSASQDHRQALIATTTTTTTINDVGAEEEELSDVPRRSKRARAREVVPTNDEVAPVAKDSGSQEDRQASPFAAADSDDDLQKGEEDAMHSSFNDDDEVLARVKKSELRRCTLSFSHITTPPSSSSATDVNPTTTTTLCDLLLEGGRSSQKGWRIVRVAYRELGLLDPRCESQAKELHATMQQQLTGLPYLLSFSVGQKHVFLLVKCSTTQEIKSVASLGTEMHTRSRLWGKNLLDLVTAMINDACMRFNTMHLVDTPKTAKRKKSQLMP